ncbi:MAG: serine/threonine protein kinase, partial [Deltaproteobacteria bacterium]|nr:serine/threonine protein kinase [Nannocystaceae bacterium]
MDPASAARAAGLPPGTQLGRYTLLRRFAVGGMAELYLAHQRGAEGFAKLVALKRILPHLACDPQLTRMFLDEARLAATLDHPNIAAVLDFGEHDGEHFLTMEYVHGRHLLDVLRAHAGRPLALPVALGIVSDVARALHHVHEQRGHDGRALGLVHRDVSPSNVLLSYEGAVKLADFGIAKAMELTSATRTGTFKGKLGYAAPEQCRGEPIDRRADVFALGILLYETTTGARAFSGPNEFAVLGRVARGDYVPPLELDPDYPAWLAPVIARALALDPGQRPATAAALADELDELAYATFERSSPTRVATMMRGSFGEAPPVTSVAELSLVGAKVLRTGTITRRRSGAMRWLGAVGMASLLVGAWAWGRAA